jgi:hypothetical protein
MRYAPERHTSTSIQPLWLNPLAVVAKTRVSFEPSNAPKQPPEPSIIGSSRRRRDRGQTDEDLAGRELYEDGWMKGSKTPMLPVSNRDSPHETTKILDGTVVPLLDDSAAERAEWEEHGQDERQCILAQVDCAREAATGAPGECLPPPYSGPKKEWWSVGRTGTLDQLHAWGAGQHGTGLIGWC